MLCTVVANARCFLSASRRQAVFWQVFDQNLGHFSSWNINLPRFIRLGVPLGSMFMRSESLLLYNSHLQIWLVSQSRVLKFEMVIIKVTFSFRVPMSLSTFKWAWWSASYCNRPSHDTNMKRLRGPLINVLSAVNHRRANTSHPNFHARVWAYAPSLWALRLYSVVFFA